tara:strand:+ start:1104 stop:3068 length:1965 start_codon:yes stop_codon:yes gene_type:complete
MSLAPYIVTVITKEDSPYNVVPNAPIEIRARLSNGSSGGLSLIYEDQQGLTPITQTGATADTNGQFVFYAAAAEYNAVYQSQTFPVDMGLTASTLQAPLDIALINDISKTHDFDTETLMKASLIVFPLKKTLTTKGKVTVNDGQGARYLAQAAQAVDGWKDVLLADGKSSLWQEGIGVFTSLNEYESFAPDNKRFAGAYGLTNIGATILVGDSITAGTGSTTYKQSYAFQVMRSIWNSLDNGDNTDRGFRYETILNLVQEFARGDIGGAASIGGNYVNGIGATNDALKIPVGTTLTITNREISSCDFFYDATATTATSVNFDLNGTVYINKALAGTGIQSTFATNIIDGIQLINDTDTIGITAVGGDVYITGLMTFRKSSLSPTVFISAQPAWGYTDFLTKAPILSQHVQTLATGKVKLIILNLGTNNIFAGIVKTPDDYLVAVQDLITAYELGMGNCKFIISVPAEGGGAFPTVLASYNEYINKIVGFCDTNGHQVLRLDKTVISKFPDNYTIDGIHPNDEGHAIEAKLICDAINVPYNRFDYRRVANSAPKPINADVTYNDTWGDFSSSAFAVKVQVEGNILSLSGIAQPNGSVSTTVAVLPVGFRPLRNAFVVVKTSTGIIGATINTTGNVDVDSVAPWVSFENINLVLNR